MEQFIEHLMYIVKIQNVYYYLIFLYIINIIIYCSDNNVRFYRVNEWERELK